MNEQTLALINDRIQNNKCLVCGKEQPEEIKETEWKIVEFNGQPVFICFSHPYPVEEKESK